MTRRLFVVGAVLALGACSLGKQSAPTLTGPSELGLSLTITATPDTLAWDGVSQSVVGVLARDPAGQPVSGLGLHVQTADQDGAIVDIGTLSSKTISTGSDGRASVTYVGPAPVAAPVSDRVIYLLVTPIDSNYANANTRQVQIDLVPPGTILPPDNQPKAAFTYSPAKPHENEEIFFDASTSTDPDAGDTLSYAWSFGDGRTGSGKTIRYHYEVAADYLVTLTVTDSRGRTDTTSTTVSVQAADALTADFTFSPTGLELAPGKTVYFNAQSSTAPTGRTIVDWAWDFGDGGSGSGDTPQHTYAAAGTYTVTLKITDDTDKTAVVSKTITINP